MIWSHSVDSGFAHSPLARQRSRDDSDGDPKFIIVAMHYSWRPLC
jgi:hypothetical protein